MKIIELRGENIKKVKAVTIRPTGPVVCVGGLNGHGKTSTLDVIAMAIGGKKLCPKMPIRKGQTSGLAAIKTDVGIEVARKFTLDDSGVTKSTLAVTGAGSDESPQGLLDKLVGRLSFDLFEFANMKPPAQAQVLRDLVGLDTSELDTKRQEAYDQRTIVNRDLSKNRAAHDIAVWHVDAPEEETSLSALVAEIDRRTEINACNAKAAAKLEAQRSFVRTQTEAVKDVEANLKTMREELSRETEEGKKLAIEVDAMKDEDAEEARALLDVAEETNSKVRDNVARAVLEDEMTPMEMESNRLTALMEEIDVSLKDMIANVVYPVRGLTTTTNEVLLDGVPFDQASTAEQIKCCAAIGAALNPKLRVMRIKNGSSLDEDSLAMITELANDTDMQIWIERVSKGDECTVVIEDGEVRKATDVASKETKAPF